MRGVFERLTLAFATTVLASTPFADAWSLAPLNLESLQQPEVSTIRKATSQSTDSLELPINFERQVGDLDRMVKHHQIRVLVVPSRSGFFYDKGQPHGIFYEAFDDFQRFVNQKEENWTLEGNCHLYSGQTGTTGACPAGGDRRCRRLPSDYYAQT